MNENEEHIVFITQFRDIKKNVQQNRKDVISANSRHVNEREQIIQRIIFLPPTAFKAFHRNDTTSFECREFRRLSDAMFQTKKQPSL